MLTTRTAVQDPKSKWRPVVRVVLFGVLVLIGLVALGGLIVLRVHKQKIGGSAADESLKTLEKEFVLITPLPGASRIRYESSHKGTLGSVSADYSTEKNYAQIRAHYDAELKEHGWRLVGEKRVKIWWKDYGGREAFYCKGPYTATIEYAGQSEEEFRWTFNLNLSWGLGDECS